MKDMTNDLENGVQHFSPTADTTRLLRHAFGRFATGVTIVTAKTEDGVIGMTANSFSSLSLEPALVMWSPAIESSRFKYFATTPHFAIHILSDQQKDICEAFAKNGHAFNEIHHSLNAHGVPLIDNCLARFECSHVATHPAGDHVIVVGQAEDVTFQDGKPLAFYAGKYGTIEAT